MKQENALRTRPHGWVESLGFADLGSWRAAFASLLPLWLIAIAVCGEGFPRPIPGQVALAAFLIAFPLAIILLIKGWMTFELVLYSIIPLIFFFLLDEITTAYKTPFILAAAALLSLGIIGYQRSLYRDSVTLAWGLLLAAAVVTMLLVVHAQGNFWQLQSDLGVGMCFLDYTGCPSLTGNEPPWWMLFLGP